MQHKLRVVFSDRAITRFMQHCDVFERFKVLTKEPMTVSLAEGVLPTVALIHRMLSAVTTNEPYGIVAIFDADVVYYRDPEVQACSDGDHWGPLDELIRHDQQWLKRLAERDRNERSDGSVAQVQGTAIGERD